MVEVCTTWMFCKEAVTVSYLASLTWIRWMDRYVPTYSAETTVLNPMIIHWLVEKYYPS